MTTGIFENNSARREVGLNRAAAIISRMAGNEAEATNAALVFRRSLERYGLTIHDVVDRIRVDAPPDRSEEVTPPAFLAMSPGVRRLWLDAIALRVRISSWERRFLSDIRGRVLSSTARVSEAQVRTLQGMVDRAWRQGVRP